jgi:hypothetical protein
LEHTKDEALELLAGGETTEGAFEAFRLLPLLLLATAAGLACVGYIGRNHHL